MAGYRLRLLGIYRARAQVENGIPDPAICLDAKSFGEPGGQILSVQPKPDHEKQGKSDTCDLNVRAG
jgi:hypothetical protein